MHPRDEEPDMAAAEGIIVGVVLSIGGVALVSAIAAWGEPAVRYAFWTVAVLAEVAR